MRAKRAKSYQRPQFLQTSPFYLVQIPFVQTSGAPGSAYEWNNWAHAALHSLLTAMKMDQKEHVQYWLGEAQRQLRGAVRRIDDLNSKVMPYGPPTLEDGKVIAERFVFHRGALWPYAPTTHQLTMGGGEL